MKFPSLVSASAVLLAIVTNANAELPSSPAELAQTRTLNQNAADGTYTSPAILNGEAKLAAQAPVAANAAVEAPANLDSGDFVALKRIDPARLTGVSVEDPSGIAIGRVTDVMLARDGTPAELAIELNDGRRVRVSEAALRFNPNDRVLLTNVDIGELRSRALAEDAEQ